MPSYDPKVKQVPATEDQPAKTILGSTLMDRVVTVKGYESVGDEAVMLAVDNDGNDLRISISDETKARTNPDSSNAKAAKFVGFQIDGRMQKVLPASSRAIIEGLELVGSDGTAKARWIHRADRNVEKTIEGLITVEVYKNHVSGVQVWSPTALTLEDENGLKALKKGFTVSFSGWEEDKKARDADPEYKSRYLPKQGFQLRAVSDGKVLEVSPRVDWNSAEKRPITWDDFKDTAKGFREHIRSKYPDATVEVCPYTDYAGGNMYEVSDGSMLARMSRSRAQLAADDAKLEYAVLGVPGVVELSPGKYDPTSGEVEGAERSIVAKIHASGPKEHIHKLVAGPDGESRAMDPALDAQWPRKAPEADQNAKREAAVSEPTFGS